MRVRAKRDLTYSRVRVIGDKPLAPLVIPQGTHGTAQVVEYRTGTQALFVSWDTPDTRLFVRVGDVEFVEG